jgi:hypothetical protein
MQLRTLLADIFSSGDVAEAEENSKSCEVLINAQTGEVKY